LGECRGVKVLLDTHALLWAILNPGRLSRQAAFVIAASENEIFVSAASAWEIATKVRLGKMRDSQALEARFLEAIDEAGFSLLSIDARTALRAARLVGSHRDPFDRILAAHAVSMDIPIVSTDEKLDMFSVRRIW
jgi:PIN domain nuclease of toxin-antitoxin system